MVDPRKCPDGSGDCIAPRLCRKTKPCWHVQKVREHEIITRAAEEAGRKSLGPPRTQH